MNDFKLPCPAYPNQRTIGPSADAILGRLGLGCNKHSPNVFTTKQKHVLVSIRSKHELESILKTYLFSFVGTNLA